MLPDRTVFIEGRFNPRMALGRRVCVKAHIGNAPTVIAFFAFHADASPSVKRGVRSCCIDHMVGLKLVSAFGSFNAEGCKVFVLLEGCDARLPAQIDRPQFLNPLYQVAFNVKLLDVDKSGLL